MINIQNRNKIKLYDELKNNLDKIHPELGICLTEWLERCFAFKLVKTTGFEIDPKCLDQNQISEIESEVEKYLIHQNYSAI